MKDVKQRNRRRRQCRRSQDHKRSVLAISAVVLLLTVMDVKGEEQRISGAGDRTERADPGRKRPVKRDQRIR